MSLRKTLFVIGLSLFVLCLAVGYGIARHWIGVMIVNLLGPAWWFARKYPGSQLSLVCLLVSVGLAVVGRLLGAPPVFMIFGAAAALAVWDILLLDSALENHSWSEQTRAYENKHFQSLTLALGSGLFVALLGHLTKIELPFVLLMFFIIFILFALDRIWFYIRKTGKS